MYVNLTNKNQIHISNQSYIVLIINLIKFVQIISSIDLSLNSHKLNKIYECS